MARMLDLARAITSHVSKISGCESDRALKCVLNQSNLYNSNKIKSTLCLLTTCIKMWSVVADALRRISASLCVSN